MVFKRHRTDGKKREFVAKNTFFMSQDGHAQFNYKADVEIQK